ncbi:dephospho-CoA kinase [Pseudarthrobacter sulfonivorans]|uniref:Dephospho-CoA kinase n=1 Tax=Pseudarthrobacter sulfonivorans TaxID=121292 RepID=A0A0U3PDC4_9MICC|nr:dephospho-CoA kinase [Pseudarthrobacter sulfonivorans]ALV43536.1 dephospho-CoA kinase [Pseudarthrobacter sulfonivorans]
MLKIGLTGGIASGKSVVATRLSGLGAVLVDADALARDVVEPGTPGLASVVEAFGAEMLDGDGRLDRARLGSVVFGNPSQLAVLNGIVHPLVRQAAAGIIAAAPAGAIVVQDIPLLVETGQGSGFHLVLVVDAPDDVRIARMLEHRGMTADEARSRMAAQASREARLAAADVVLDNSGSLADVTAQVDRLWAERLVPFARNLRRSVRAVRAGMAVLSVPQQDWAAQAARLGARIQAAAPDDILAVDHIGSTAVPGLAAKDVIDLQVTVSDLNAADRIAPLLAAAGFPAVPGVGFDTPKPTDPDPAQWQKRFHANADPGRPANVHVRAAGSSGWRYALLFRDWLRNDPQAAALYEDHKRALTGQFAGSKGTHAYAEAKEPWFTDVAWPRMDGWAARTGWAPPSYAS